MSSTNDFTTPFAPNWCPGCGNFSIWACLKSAITQLGWGPSDFVMVYGIGCHGHMVNFLKSYAAETLHGRPIPFAEGLKLANHKLPIIVVAGDGDTFGEGTNHLVHLARRNHDITMILHDNQVYGLTTGQTAPTSHTCFKSKSTPQGVIDRPVNPLAVTIGAGATFVARGSAGDIPKLTNLIVEGIKHKGFSFIDSFQPRVTFNHINTYQWYRSHVYELENHDVTDRAAAFNKAIEWPDGSDETVQDGGINARAPIGVFYKVERPTYEEQLPQLSQASLVEQEISKINISSLLEDFK